MPKNDAVYVTGVGTILTRKQQWWNFVLPTWNKEKNIVIKRC